MLFVAGFVLLGLADIGWELAADSDWSNLIAEFLSLVVIFT